MEKTTAPKCFAVIGTDARQAAAGRALARAGYAVGGAEQVALADYILLPLPLDAARTPLAELLRAARPGALALGGMLSAEAQAIAAEAGVELVDYFAREELTIRNAVPTAEGALEILLHERSRTLWGSAVLLLGFGGNSFALFFKNSFFVTILVTIGTVLSSSFIAFGFARIRFRGRSFWFVMMIITMLLPGQVMIIPRYVMFNNMGWVGTFLPLIIPPFFGGAFNIFLIMQFIRGIPRDMDESAKIDGCSWYGIYWRILLPLVVPALVTVGVLAFIGSWEDFMGSLLYLNTPRKYTVAYALKLFNDTQKTDYGATFAMSALSMVPVLILFFFFQKQLVEGISMQGIKG